MAIHPSYPPAAAVDAVRRAVVSRAGKSKIPSSKLSLADPDAIFISMPHRIAHLPLGNVHRGSRLRTAAVLGSWRFLIHERKRRMTPDDVANEEYVPIAAATMVTRAASETYELGDLNEGPLVAMTEGAIRSAEVLPEVRKGQFEVLLLMVPAVQVTALWLKDREGDADLLLTIPPSSQTLVSSRPMASTAFLDMVDRLSRKNFPDEITAGCTVRSVQVP